VAKEKATANAEPGISRTKAEQMLEVLSTKNHVPIEFYGRLEDQFGTAVPNARVRFNVHIQSGNLARIEEGQTDSDVNGLFAISGYRGERLSLAPEKSGYVLASTNCGGVYSELYPPEQRIHPDPNDPIVIRMWRLQGAEPLIHFQVRTRLDCNGVPAAFDLRTGKRVDSGGDVVIRIESSTKPDVIQKYDWKATVQVPDGGIVPSDGMGLERMFQAPESGYEREVCIGYDRNSKPWSSRFNGGFFIKARGGGLYGKVDLSITTDFAREGSVPVSLGGYVNLAGSRNLEIDLKLVTEAGR
jgi:hypothetical protein